MGKRALLLELAARLPMTHAERVVKIFKQIDANGDGGMSKEELQAYFDKLGLKDHKLIGRTFVALDVDGDGVLSFSEFAAGVLLQYGDLLEERFRALFRKHDLDCDGVLTREEARTFLANILHMASRETRKKPDDAFNELFQFGNDRVTYEDLKSKVLHPVR